MFAGRVSARPPANAPTGAESRKCRRLRGAFRAGLCCDAKGDKMDNVTLIRVVAGVLAVVVVLILVFRMKKKAPR